MSKSPRLHEVSKALEVTSKALMAELSQAGFEFKTHMAAVEADAYSYLLKNYPQLEKALVEFEKKKAASPKPKTKRKKIAKKSEMVTSRTKAAGEQKSRSVSEPAAPAVEILKEKGGDTVEQKRIQGGIIRRRKVEEVKAPEPEVAPVSEPTEAEAPSFVAEETQTVPEIQASEPDLEPSDEVSSEAPSEAPSTQEIKIDSSREASRVSSRNLSAPRKLKIVGHAAAPVPPQPVVSSRPASPSTSVKTIEEEKKAKEEKAAEKKKAKNWVAPKVNKRQLLGMTEEVEISRPTGRRQKKQARTEGKTKITTPSAQKRKIKIDTEVTVAELADRMAVKAADVVRQLIQMGQMISAHQVIDFETATLVAGEYGYEVENVGQTAETLLESHRILPDTEEGEKTERAPIVTIMGHVDHGKTSLLDYIRSSRVAAGEAGGITQHIGAYQVVKNSKPITFLDTPGHEAFTKMRARGAGVTDIVILVCAADEGPKPQTIEAIAHARSAKVPIIVALNKIDKPDAQPDKVMQELSGHELVPEEWGGDVMYIKVSAQTGEGVEALLEAILLQAELLELKAQVGTTARGIVIESLLDKGKGPVATVLVLDGEVKQGDPVVSGSTFGKVRAMFNDRGESIQVAGPSQPVEILGFSSVPEVGDNVHSVTEESIARKASDLSQQAKRMEEQRKKQRISLEEMYEKMKTGEINELRVVLKGDVQGSVEAIQDSLLKITHDEVKVNVVYRAVGGITESDVSLAAASGALVLGFNVRPAGQAKAAAAHEGVQIKTYSVIYELIDDVKLAMQGLLAPEIKESVIGQAEVRDVFNLSKVGIVAGCYVKSGKIMRNAHARLIRDNVVIYDTPVQSVRRFKEDAREVAEGFECGIRLENYTDLKPGDLIECYEKVEIKKAVS